MLTLWNLGGALGLNHYFQWQLVKIVTESASVTYIISLICPSIEVLKLRSWLRQTDRRDLGFRTSTDARTHAISEINYNINSLCCVRASVKVLKPTSRLSVCRSQDLGFRTSIDGHIKEMWLVSDTDSVIAGQLHQCFVCAANTVHKKRCARVRE